MDTQELEVSQLTPYYSRLFLTTAANSPIANNPSSTGSLLKYDTIDYDPGNETQTGAIAGFVAAITGLYLITWGGGVSVGAGSTYWTLSVNSSTGFPQNPMIGIALANVYNNDNQQPNVAKLVFLRANDSLQLFHFQNSGAGVNALASQSEEWFEVTLLRRL